MQEQVKLLRGRGYSYEEVGLFLKISKQDARRLAWGVFPRRNTIPKRIIKDETIMEGKDFETKKKIANKYFNRWYWTMKNLMFEGDYHIRINNDYYNFCVERADYWAKVLLKLEKETPAENIACG